MKIISGVILAVVLLSAAGSSAFASETDGPYNSPLRIRCADLAVSVAKRTGQVSRSEGGFIQLPLASNGGIMNGRHYCSTSCETYVRQFEQYGQAEMPTVRCFKR